MSEYECGHEIFDYNEDGTYVKECHLCKPEPMTLQQQLAEMGDKNTLTDADGFTFVADTEKEVLISTLQAILDIEKKKLSGSHNTFTAGMVAGYNSALATVAEVAGEAMRG